MTKRTGSVTTNTEGGRAYVDSSRKELTNAVLTTFLTDSYYESGSDRKSRIGDLIVKVGKSDPQFVANLATVARRDFNLRKVPMFVITELAKVHKGDSLVSNTIVNAVKRVDDCFSLLAFDTSYKSNQIKKGVRRALSQFDEYELSKYKLAGSTRFTNAKRAVGLVDAFNLVHPAPPRGKAALFERVMNNSLKIPETWETFISVNGSTAANWEAIAPKMPYMATLRNLRNFLEHKVSEQTINLICERISNPEAVKRSMQFPYRFFSAYRSIIPDPDNYQLQTEAIDSPFVGQVADSIEKALEISVSNVPHFKGTTFMAADNSGSMQSKLTDKSIVSRENVANLMMAMAAKTNDKAITSIFGDTFRVKPMPSSTGILANMRTVRNNEVGSSTNAWLSIDYLLDRKINVDRILIFSDEQCYNTYEEDGRQSERTMRASYDHSLAGRLSAYRRTINPDVFVYVFNLAGYGTSQFSEKAPNVLQLAGFSDKVFQLMKLAEQGSTLVDYISNYKPTVVDGDEESDQ